VASNSQIKTKTITGKGGNLPPFLSGNGKNTTQALQLSIVEKHCHYRLREPGEGRRGDPVGFYFYCETGFL